MNQQLDGELMQIESLLRRAASSLPYPPTPDLTTRVRARLDERPTIADRLPRFSGWRWPASAVAALAVVAAVAVGAALSLPASRSALADFFHLSHVRIERAPAGSPTPPPLAPGNFARPSSVAFVERVADFPILLPTSDEQRILPDAVYVQGESSRLPTGIFVYRDYDLYETRLSYFAKAVPDPSLIHNISFDGQAAYWIDQGGHIAQFLDSSGRVVIETRRTVDRATLIWEENGITYRLESSLPQAQTVAVAQSLR